MKRRLLILLTALSLVLCIATVALWVRSFFVADVLTWFAENSAGGVRSTGGTIICRRIVPAEGGKMPRGLLDPQPSGVVYRAASPAENVRPFDPKWAVAGFSAVEGTVAVFDPGASTSRNVRVCGVTVADWSIVAATAVLPCWRLVRRARAARPREPGLCPACGYDVRATPERCPECGHVQVRDS